MDRRSMTMPALCSILALAGLACEDDDDDNGTGDDVGEGEGEEATDLSAVLSGAAERPEPVATTMTGEAEFFANASRTAIVFALDVANGVDIIAAHIHLGGPEVAGPVIVQLFGPADPAVDRDGRLSDGTITEEDLVGELEGSTIDDLVQLMLDGDTYVNVHTVIYPDGAVRGQIEPGPLPGDDVE